MLLLLYTATFLFMRELLKEPFLCRFAAGSDQHCSLLLGFFFPVMKTLIRISATLIPVPSAQADQFKVHYSLHGSGKDIIVKADSSDDARHTVEDMFLHAVATGVRKVRELPLLNHLPAFFRGLDGF